MEYMNREVTDNAFIEKPISGFKFNTTDTELTIVIVQVKAVTSKASNPRLHGILSDGVNIYTTADEMLKANYEEAVADKIKEALITQINDYLSTK